MEEAEPEGQINGKTRAKKGKSKRKADAAPKPGLFRTTKVKTRGDPRISTDEEDPMSEEEEHHLIPSPSKISKTPTVEITTSPGNGKNSPKRTVSVVMPGLKVGSSTPSPKKTNVVTRNESIHVASLERRRPGTSTRPGPSTGAADSSPMSVASATSRVSKRAAATRASQRLHEEIMPDVLNFQQEMKRKGKGRESLVFDSKRRRSSTAVTEPEEDEEDVSEISRPTKREKAAVGQGPKGSRKTEKQSASSRDGPAAKKRKSAADELSDLSDSDMEKNKPSERPQKKRKMAIEKSGESSAASKTVRLMTTQLKLEQDEIDSLKSMGVKMTTKWSECTHLVVPQLVRTEKFLCALARSPYILTIKWVHDSISAGKLLSEDRYFLKDEVNEKKHGFRLVDSLARAKQNKGALFKDKRFYITGKVDVDYGLLKHVVEANGGQVSNQQPTLRILDNDSDNRFVISCPKDASIWRPLAEKYTIYTSELILTAALKHEIEWDNDAFRVSGSF
ncbi:hypothetical protein D9758_001947 [Tetrapyrgos nigripes]|uniref:BRCT domain-containing protein n=1 Tax=Tetrapyrgos nigripes TaxID=182062 RepID=A0A8H5GTT7_9AGAR|nr:hypothetical protein D9758_001947 [Tetrapyrgos nigripes]